MNKFIGIGNICKDIELKSTNSGKYVLQNSIAIRNDFKNADGEYDSEFVNIVVWGNTAEYMQKYARKGMKIAVEGRLQTKIYDKADGTRGYVTEVVCNNVELLEKINQIKSNTTSTEKDPYEEFGELIETKQENDDINLDDLELPFE